MPLYPPAGTGSGVTDHGALTGLADDDHTQYILHSLADAKGDILAASAADVLARLAVGTDGHVLTADAAQALGIKWAAATGNPGVATVGGWQDFVLAADDTSAAATTNRNVTGWTWTMIANARYTVDFYIFFTPAAATTGLGLAFDTAVAVTRQGLSFTHQLATTGTLSGGDAIADAAARGLSSGVPAAALTFALGRGAIAVGASGGACQVIWRPEVAAVSVLNAGSVMRVTRVA